MSDVRYLGSADFIAWIKPTSFFRLEIKPQTFNHLNTLLDVKSATTNILSTIRKHKKRKNTR